MTSDYTRSNVLITGGFGYVGSRLTPHLLKQGYGVRVLDLCLYGDDGLVALSKDSEYPKLESRFELIRGDLRDPDVVSLATKEIDCIIHLAAISNDPTGEIDDTLTRQVNFDAVGMLLSIAKQNGVRRFINASFSSVFGSRSESEIDESLEPEPITSYSRYKMLNEWLVRSAASKDFATVNIRPATICGYSPRQRFDLTVNKLTADAIRKGLITVHGGEQRRPNVGMTDMIHLYNQLVDCEAEEINGNTFNFGFENLKIIEIAQLIRAQLSDREIEISVTAVHDARDYHISSRKILKTLSYSPVSSIAQEVEQLTKKLSESLEFPDIDAAKHHNMKSMRLEREPGCYRFLR